MTITPTRIEHDIGRDLYGRHTRLICERKAGGSLVWSIISEPVCQRDDGERIHSLTSAQLIQAGEIAAGHGKAGRT